MSRKSELLQVRVSADEKKKAQALAAKEGESLSVKLRELLRAWLAQK